MERIRPIRIVRIRSAEEYFDIPAFAKTSGLIIWLFLAAVFIQNCLGLEKDGAGFMIRQRTLRNAIKATGVGLHTGEKVFLLLLQHLRHWDNF